jgi:hypothetical protein
MKQTKPQLLAFICAAALLVCTTVSGADSRKYQVTGPVLAITPTTITVQKGEEKWEISRDSSTRIEGDLKVGSKVTIYYSMVATLVEVKESKAKK